MENWFSKDIETHGQVYQGKDRIRIFCIKGINLRRTQHWAVNNQENCLYPENRRLSDYKDVQTYKHTSTYRVNNSIAHYRIIGLCICIIFTIMLLKYFITNSVAMMKYLAGVMAFGIYTSLE